MDSDQLARKVSHRLQQHSDRIVLAESCTAGLIAATLGQVPGISQLLCGSAVVYRELTKVGWLEVDEQQLAKHTAVSQFASNAIAGGVLRITPEATISLGITGHLGPNAPEGMDGQIFLAMARRSGGDHNSTVKHHADAAKQLQTDQRVDRQNESVELALGWLLEQL